MSGPQGTLLGPLAVSAPQPRALKLVPQRESPTPLPTLACSMACSNWA
eukprot:CAMPEP_0179139284 /NCGR_PEP_ID=MMETSP0796-20121207/66610_1 /TAXON_ID=73915 /ORGANISM="Pyrodinium bahamense, Strain pbaha01" /LENGTH=47 /DNA_ID= /DNA_START= /DNA_END= /DNA_ORIENTATION=